MRRRAAPLIAGACVAASMPPWGWWPLAFLGCALYARIATHQGRETAFRTGAWWAAGWFAPSLAWMWFLSLPGYLAVVAIFSFLHGSAALLALRLSRGDPARHRRLLVAFHALAEAVRLSFPFGGVPLSTLAISQARSPLVSLAPWGGAILITWAVLALSFLGWRARAGIIAAVLAASLVPTGVSPAGTATFAVVQGGGEQGTHVGDVDPREVFLAHLDLTRTIEPRAERTAVVWPENVINLTGEGTFHASREHAEVTAEARRLGVPFLVGITEDALDGRFTNAQVVVETDGSVVSRYDKKRRVPFGEFMPMRSVLDALGAPVSLVPRDAAEGTTPACLTAAGAVVATAISWEVFFGGRVNEGIECGGRIVINPTNGSSYTWTILQTQQVASSLLRAREQDRWVVQAAPTGFSAFVAPRGEVLDRTAIGEARVIERTVELRTGRTLYSRAGNAPYIWALCLGVLTGLRRRRRRAPEGHS